MAESPLPVGRMPETDRVLPITSVQDQTVHAIRMGHACRPQVTLRHRHHTVIRLAPISPHDEPPGARPTRHRLINIDNGGTLTDICVMDGDQVIRTKTLTTPHDLSQCLFDGLRKASVAVYGKEDLEALLLSTNPIRYSTTQGTNALVERKGPRLGLVIGGALTVEQVRSAEGATDLFDAVIGSRAIALSDGAAETDIVRAVGELAAAGANRIVVPIGGPQRADIEPRLKRKLLRSFPPHLLGALPILYANEVADDADDARGMWTALFNAFRQARTEGWPAGLQLFKLALARDDVRHTLDEMRDCTPFELVRYLSENALSLQRPEVQAFMLKTSQLRRLSASLCEEVTGVRDTQALLQQLEQGGSSWRRLMAASAGIAITACLRAICPSVSRAKRPKARSMSIAAPRAGTCAMACRKKPCFMPSRRANMRWRSECWKNGRHGWSRARSLSRSPPGSTACRCTRC